ncbi:MAG: hypothetical protein MJB14_04500 [Spirochaetes bacterium]|nr:hypothetical protein [Spirochaetota bacterium]
MNAYPINFKNLYNLLKIEILNNINKYFLVVIIINIIYFSLNILQLQNNQVIDPSGSLVLLIILGFIVISQTFSEFQESEQSTYYLLIPASQLEKWFSKWLVSSIIYFIISVMSLMINVLFLSLLKSILLTSSFQFTFFSFLNVLKTFLFFITFHSIFFFGSIFFKKNQFLKTLFTLVLLFFVLALATSIITGFYLMGIAKFILNNQVVTLNDYQFNFSFNDSNLLVYSFRIFTHFVIPGILYFLSFWLLKKKEV